MAALGRSWHFSFAIVRRMSVTMNVDFDFKPGPRRKGEKRGGGGSGGGVRLTGVTLNSIEYRIELCQD